MGVLRDLQDRLFGANAPQLTDNADEQRATGTWSEGHIKTVNRMFFESGNGVEPITERTAMTLSSVWACVRIIMESVAMMKRKVVRVHPDGSEEEITDHNLLYYLNLRPNPRFSANILKQSELKDVCLYGNSLTYIDYYRNGDIKQLTKIPFEDIEKAYISERTGKLYWDTKYGRLPDERICHYKIVPDECIWGLSPIQWHRQTLETIAQAENFGEQFFKQGAYPSGFLSVQGMRDDSVRQRTKAELKKMSPGEIMVLDAGTEWKKIGAVPEDVMWLSTLTDMDKRVGAIFRVPTYMFSDTEKPGYNSLEQLALDFKQYTVKPYATMIEQEDTYKLLSKQEIMSGLCIKFDYESLDITGIDALGEFITTLLTQGIMNINEVRSKYFQKGPIEYGDENLVQGNNMTTLKNAVEGRVGGFASTLEQNGGNEEE